MSGDFFTGWMAEYECSCADITIEPMCVCMKVTRSVANAQPLGPSEARIVYARDIGTVIFK
jgi:hypothetical protein